MPTRLGDVGARTGLAEQLAPHLFTGEQRAQVALALLLAAVGDDRSARPCRSRWGCARRRTARPPLVRISLMTRCNFGLRPRPPSPSGKLHPGQAGVELGAEELDGGGLRRGVVDEQLLRALGDFVLSDAHGHERNLTRRSRRSGRAPPDRCQSTTVPVLGLSRTSASWRWSKPGRAASLGTRPPESGRVVGDDAAPFAAAVEDEPQPVVPRASGQGRGSHLEQLVPAHLLVAAVGQRAAHAPVVDDERHGGGRRPPIGPLVASDGHERGEPARRAGTAPTAPSVQPGAQPGRPARRILDELGVARRLAPAWPAGRAPRRPR